MSAVSGTEHSMVETRHQTRLLTLLRDEGPMSRVELGERLELPRARVGAEVARLAEVGLVEAAGPSASRGGRRST
ncbi:sugar kinase, partial [Amycolatopsis sp. SID8362]